MKLKFERRRQSAITYKKDSQDVIVAFLKEMGFRASLIEDIIVFQAKTQSSVDSGGERNSGWKFIRSGKCSLDIDRDTLRLKWKIDMGSPIFTSLCIAFVFAAFLCNHFVTIYQGGFIFIGSFLIMLGGFVVNIKLKFKRYSRQLFTTIEY
ncbi:hypothetical protein DMA11_06010 [Marinilabiliaceae bacterium JC017]|nr:hypothetical protein DMA11_06010 [Marinilabiliaceae bacterium JC017]